MARGRLVWLTRVLLPVAVLLAACGDRADDDAATGTTATTTTATTAPADVPTTTAATVPPVTVRYDLPGSPGHLGPGRVAYVAPDLSAVVARVLTEGLTPGECVTATSFPVLHRLPLDLSAPVAVAGGTLTGLPSVGPEGRLALVDRCAGGTSRITVGRITASGDVGELREVPVTEPLLVESVRWSADGERLVAAVLAAGAGPDEPTGRIVSIAVASGEVEDLLTVPGAIDAAQLDGAVAVATPERVSVHDPSTGAERGAVSGGGALAVSPDGTTVAVQHGSLDLLTAAGEVSTLVEQAGRGQYLVWSPDGTVLVGVSELPAGEQLVLTTVPEGAQQVLDAGGDLSRPAFSADGTIVGYSGGGAEPDVFVIQFPVS